MRVYISPTEHSEAIKSLGVVSSIPEMHGADVLAISGAVRLGVQRKAVQDFFASVMDGRLSKEVAQLTTSPILTHAALIIEGRLDWTNDGQSTLPYVTITLNGYRSLITSIQQQSIIVHTSSDSRDTAALIPGLCTYLTKPHHASLRTRPKQSSPWGRRTSRTFGSHLLQSFPGIGAELADRIYDHFSTIPLAWTITEADLATVSGIGPKRAAQLWESLMGGSDTV